MGRNEDLWACEGVIFAETHDAAKWKVTAQEQCDTFRAVQISGATLTLAAKANVQDLSITKSIDASRSALMLACWTSTRDDIAQLAVPKAGDSSVEYVIIDLTEVLLAAISTGGSDGEDCLTENVTINFGKVKFASPVQDAQGKPRFPPKEMTFNIAENVSEWRIEAGGPASRQVARDLPPSLSLTPNHPRNTTRGVRQLPLLVGFGVLRRASIPLATRPL